MTRAQAARADTHPRRAVCARPRRAETPNRPRHRLWQTVIAAGLVAFSSSAEAQYFGRNKVRIDAFPFRVTATEHFDVYFYPEERDGAREAARLAERWYARLSRYFDHHLSTRQPLILYASPAQFQQTNVIEGELGEGTGGVTESLRRRIVLPLGGSLAATDHVIGHELVHAFQFDITAKARRASPSRVGGAGQLPLWFVEGMAEYLSRGPTDAETAMWLRDAAAREALPTIRRLNDSRYFPYRWGHAFWAYVAGRYGEGAVVAALHEAGRSGDAEAALEAALATSMADVARDWHAAIHAVQAPWLARAPAAPGRPILKARREGELNVGPALSPDGRRVAFLAERDLLSVDLFVAEVGSGRLVRRVASSARDAHTTGLQFIASAGAWDPTGQRLAFASRRGRTSAIEIVHVDTGARDSPMRPVGVDDLLTPAWSPSGDALAFVGMRQGHFDVFVATRSTGAIEAKTSDAFAELHPVWWPDGRSLVIATDRFTTDWAGAAAGRYQLARLWLDGRVERLCPEWPGQMLTPQWADRTGSALLFVGDRGGVPNVWRLDVASCHISPVTDLLTGVTGITPTSPALSTAPAAAAAAISAIDGGGHRLFLIDTAAPVGTAGDLAPDAGARLTTGTLSDGEVATYLADSRTGLPPVDAPFNDTPYRARLGLDAIVQPSVGIGVDRFGTFAAGQIAMLWGDLLGDRTLVTAFQANATVDASFSYRDLGGLLGYVDRSRRWPWAVTLEQTPYRTGYLEGGVGRVNGQTAYVEREVIYRQTIQGGSGIVAYPLDTARRVEFGAGVQRYSFEERVRTIATAGGRTLLDDVTTTPVADALTLARTQAALVFDRSSFGATGPVLGQRYRLEVAPTVGTIRYAGVLADYRRYLMPVPFYTVAGRVLHYGRYGAGGEDPRLSPLFLGYPELVRGYDVGSFRAEECTAGGCEVFDRLLGSRLLVVNAELRMPLLRPFGLGGSMYGPLPIEVAVFGDAGVAWTRRLRPAFAGGGRDWATSAGVAARLNAFGFAILQVSAARPFQRPGRGWVYQISLTPGF